jgi:hypothetical protein
MQITTSFGRRLKATNKGMPWEYPEDGSSEWHNLVSPHGEIITGFLAHPYVSIESLFVILSFEILTCICQDEYIVVHRRIFRIGTSRPSRLVSA